VQENYRARFSYSPELVQGVAARCHEVESGARNVDHILTRTLLPELSALFLSRMAEGQELNQVYVTVDAKDAFDYQVS
jgi:type VI secretion system protein VasG